MKGGRRFSGAELVRAMARRVLRKELSCQARALADARAQAADPRAVGLNEKAQAQRLLFNYAFEPRARFGYGDLPPHRELDRLLRAQESTYQEVLTGFLRYKPEFEAIPVTGTLDSDEPFWTNLWFPTLDAVSLYGLLARFQPRHYVEVGSGNSTKFARRAIRDQGLRTQIISIDPEPRAEIDQLCDEIHRVPAEDLGDRLLQWLASGDLLFVDNSHRSFMNTDVTVFFLEVLPRLPAGCIWGLHDIFLPYDYPPDWAGRFYNEQYLLAMYLLGGVGQDEILLANAYASRSPQLLDLLEPIWSSPRMAGARKGGGCFWMRRRG
jgi:methyltransferase family protein